MAGPADISSGLLLVKLVAACQLCCQNAGMSVLNLTVHLSCGIQNFACSGSKQRLTHKGLDSS